MVTEIHPECIFVFFKIESLTHCKREPIAMDDLTTNRGHHFIGRTSSTSSVNAALDIVSEAQPRRDATDMIRPIFHKQGGILF